MNKAMKIVLTLLASIWCAASVPTFRCVALQGTDGWHEIYFDKVKTTGQVTTVWVQVDGGPPNQWHFNLRSEELKIAGEDDAFLSIPPGTVSERLFSMLPDFNKYSKLDIPIFRQKKHLRVSNKVYIPELYWYSPNEAVWLEKRKKDSRLWVLSWRIENNHLIHDLCCYQYFSKSNKVKWQFSATTVYINKLDRDLLNYIGFPKDTELQDIAPESPIGKYLIDMNGKGRRD